MKLTRPLILSLFIATLALPAQAAPKWRIKGILRTTAAVAGTMAAHEFGCWENIGALLTEGYSLTAAGILPAGGREIFLALNAGCAFVIVGSVVGGTEMVCRLGQYVYERSNDDRDDR
jgi:hypothetical protein